MFRYGTERGIAFTRTRPYRKNDNCLVEVIKFDQARTPYQRILASPHVPERAKAELTRTYIELNPAELKQQIATCQERLLHINRTKPDRTKEVNRPTHVRQLAPAWALGLGGTPRPANGGDPFSRKRRTALDPSIRGSAAARSLHSPACRRNGRLS